MEMQSTPSSSNRILYDVPCCVCRDHSSGKHYGVFACDGCAGFFKRSVRRARRYACKARAQGQCLVDKAHRNQCRACRLSKCLEAGMNRDAVQHERGPRNSTLRRQMALYLKDPAGVSPPDLLLSSPPPMALDLALPKHRMSQQAAAMTRIMSEPSCAYFMTQPDLTFIPNMAIDGSNILGTNGECQALMSSEAVCEAAARLLFMNVKWAKNVPAFSALSLPDRLILLEESWRELFVLGAAQFLMPLDLSQLVAERQPSLAADVKVFQDTLLNVAKLQVDAHEFACLRAIVLFKSSLEGGERCSESMRRRLHDPRGIAALQDHTQLILNKYVSTSHRGQPLRFGRLLLLVPSLRAVSPTTIEELFFRNTIGNIAIERIISDMYRGGAADL